MFGHVPLLAAGFAGDRLSPDLPVLQQVEQSPRAEQAEEKGGTTKKHKGHKGRLGSPEWPIASLLQSSNLKRRANRRN
jgi:hypothetical protein